MVDTDDNYVSFGTSLDPIEEEEIARKKPITIADQIATDEQGRRRFHGAFTGGFSAGYYNTVGSKEGWTPSTFKSSRSERFASNSNKGGQHVKDFMDDEDMGAFGIAPQVLRPTEDFTMSEAQNTSRKRAKPKQSEGPIPGVPVLHHIIEPVKETVGIKILVKMGWRPGQGVGPRVARKKGKKKDKRKEKHIDKPTIVDEDIDMESISTQKVYGCQMPSGFQKDKNEDEDSTDPEIDADVLYAPEDVESPLCNPKENRFGLGYKGLERLSGPTGHVDLFGKQLKFGKVDSKNKKPDVHVTGEAFGIGAFEEPDEDVYNREDMSGYDFELETTEERKVRKTKEAVDKSKKKQKDSCIEGFHFATYTKNAKKYFAPPHLPHNFQPVHRSRKSRFDAPATKPDDSTSKRGLGRHALTVQQRQVLLGEEPTAPLTTDNSNDPSKTEAEEVLPENDVSIQERVERIKKFVQVLQAHSTPAVASGTAVSQPVFQPFNKNPEKQERYEKYLTLVGAGFQDCLKEIQPQEMTEWEREREKQEFDRAGSIYKPLSGVMSSRFVSAKSHDISHIVPEKEIVKEKDPSEDPKVAARLNLFGKLTHSAVEWHPEKVLCKRFNMKDPFPDSKFVGLRGVPSIKVNSKVSTTNSISETETPVAVATPATKKSLFDNLDFSKPPPGLQPFSNNNTNEAEPQSSTEGESIKTEGQSKKLEFQTNLTAELDDKENVPVKAPLDLFKQIFADSSDESEPEEDNKEQQKEPLPPATSNSKDDSRPITSSRNSSNDKKTSPPRSNDRENRRKSDNNNDRDRKILYEKRYTREDREARRESRIEEREKPRGKGIFDNLDLTWLSHKPNDDNDKGDLMKEAIEKEEEVEDELLYGPRAPIKANSNANSSKPQQQSTSSHLPFNSQFQFQKAPTLSAYKTTAVTKAFLKPEEEEVVWVEKQVVEQTRSKSKKHSTSTKKSKKSKSKKEKKEKHKKNKKHKSKKSKRKSLSGHLENSSSSDEDSDSSSVEMHGSLNQKALLAHLKHITGS